MRRRVPSGDELLLSDRLKREARETRPVFSENLHDRIRDAIQHDRPDLKHPLPTKRWKTVTAPMAVAATVLLSALAIAWWVSRPSSVTPELANAPGETERTDEAQTIDLVSDATDETVEQLSLLVDSTLTNPQWAYLDHDVQVAARLLMEQFPTVEALE